MAAISAFRKRMRTSMKWWKYTTGSCSRPMASATPGSSSSPQRRHRSSSTRRSACSVVADRHGRRQRRRGRVEDGQSETITRVHRAQRPRKRTYLTVRHRPCASATQATESANRRDAGEPSLCIALANSRSKVHRDGDRRSRGRSASKVETAAICGVGDSRVYLVADWQIKQLTTDHTWVETIRTQDPTIEPEALARCISMRHVLTAVIGGSGSGRCRRSPSTSWTKASAW